MPGDGDRGGRVLEVAADRRGDAGEVDGRTPLAEPADRRDEARAHSLRAESDAARSVNRCVALHPEVELGNAREVTRLHGGVEVDVRPAFGDRIQVEAKVTRNARLGDVGGAANRRRRECASDPRIRSRLCADDAGEDMNLVRSVHGSPRCETRRGLHVHSELRRGGGERRGPRVEGARSEVISASVSGWPSLGTVTSP